MPPPPSPPAPPLGLPPSAVLLLSHRVSGALNASEYFRSITGAGEARNASVGALSSPAHKFSALHRLDGNNSSFRNATGAFTLFLVYPELRPGANFNAWTQSSHPTAERPVAGYSPLTVSFAGARGGTFGGLRLSASSNATLADGTADSATNWWFAVAQYGIFTGLATSGFCAPGVAGGLPGPQSAAGAPLLECAGAACARGSGVEPCLQAACCTRWVQLWALPAVASPPP